MDDAMNELDMDIEMGEYTGPGSGKHCLPDGTRDPNDHIKNEAYYKLLVEKFYAQWQSLFGVEVIHDKDKDARDQCDQYRLKLRMANG